MGRSLLSKTHNQHDPPLGGFLLRKGFVVMSRRPAVITQADVARIVRAAKQAGAAEVEVRVGEATVVVRLASSTGAETSLEESRKVIL
jgi:hypothetical protein